MLGEWHLMVIKHIAHIINPCFIFLKQLSSSVRVSSAGFPLKHLTPGRLWFDDL